MWNPTCFKFLCSLALVSCLSFSVFAEEKQPELAGKSEKSAELVPVGSVIAITGKATAKQPDGEIRKLKLKSPIYKADEVKTKSKSSLQISFDDTTTIGLGQKARMVVEEFVYKSGDPSSKCETSITSGAFKLLGGTISKMSPDSIKIKTPSATIGVRGTLGIGEVTEGETTIIYMGGVGLWVTGVAKGEDLENGPAGPQGPGDLGGVLLTGQGGMGTKVPSGSPPPPPRIFLPSEINGLLGDLNPPQGDDDDDDDGGAGGTGDDDDDDDDGAPAPPPAGDGQGGGDGGNASPGKPEEPKIDVPSVLDPESSQTEVVMKGYSVAVLADNNSGNISYLATGDGDDAASGQQSIDTPTGTTISQNSASSWMNFDGYAVNAYSSTGTYSSVTTNNDTDTMSLKGVDQTVDVSINSDNLGQFMFFTRETQAAVAYDPSGTGDYAWDFSEKNNYGTGASTATQLSSSEAKVGNGAYSFTGSSQINVVNSGDLNLTSATDYSYSVWVNMINDADSANANSTIINNASGGQEGTNIQTGNQDGTVRVSVGIGSDVIFDTSGDLSDGTWHLVTLVYESDSDTLTLYVDGSVINSTSTGGAALTAASSLTIGGDGNTYYHGSLDDLRIYDRALTASEIGKLFANNASTLDELAWGMVANLTFDKLEYEYAQLSFAGVETESTPTDGVNFYGDWFGNAANTPGSFIATLNIANTTLDYLSGDAYTGVNFKNRKFISVYKGDDGDLLVSYGNANTDGSLSGKMLNTLLFDSDKDDWYVVDGTVNGQLYGTDSQGIGFSGSGSNNLDSGSSAALSWETALAGFKNTDTSKSASATGTLNYNAGWATGVSMDITTAEKLGTAGKAARDTTIWKTADSTDVTFSLDYDTGAASGAITNLNSYSVVNAAEDYKFDYTLDGSDSAFVTPDLYVSVVSSVTDNRTCKDDTVTVLDDQSYALALPNESTSGNDVAALGRWAVRYNYYDDSESFTHNMYAYGYFVSGAQADLSTYLSDMRANSVIGTYSGSAYATYIKNSSTITDLSGTCDFTVNFGSDSVTGTMALSPASGSTHHLSVTAKVDSAGLTNGAISNWSIGDSSVNLGGGSTSLNGSFYGSVDSTTSPDALGGTFSAGNSDGTEAITGAYLGGLTNSTFTPPN